MAKQVKKFLQFLASRTFLLLTLVGNFVLLLAVTTVYFLEKNANPAMEDYLDALWWGVTTITTVGYGDVVPVTDAARVIGLILMYTGTVLFIGFTSLIATYWVRTEVTKEISPLEKGMKKEARETKNIETVLMDIQERLKRIEQR